jgi:hypothetical protein
MKTNRWVKYDECIENVYMQKKNINAEFNLNEREREAEGMSEWEKTR